MGDVIKSKGVGWGYRLILGDLGGPLQGGDMWVES